MEGKDADKGLGKQKLGYLIAGVLIQGNIFRLEKVKLKIGHIALYVNEYSKDLSPTIKAISVLVDADKSVFV